MRILGQIHCDKETRHPVLTAQYDPEGNVAITKMTVWGTQMKLPATASNFVIPVTIEQALPCRDVVMADQSLLRIVGLPVAQMDHETFQRVIQDCGVREALTSLLDAVRSRIESLAISSPGDSQRPPSSAETPSPEPLTEPSGDSPNSTAE